MKYLVAIISLILLSILSFQGYSQKLGKDNSLEVITWNLEWFGNPEKGPKDEKKQMEVAYQIIGELGMVDVIVFEEICDSKLFKRLADTTGYNYYLSPGSDNLQKIGMFYSKDLSIIGQPMEILLEHKSTFAQRLPVMLTFNHKILGEVSVIGIHLKANIPSATAVERKESYDKRKESASLIQNYVSTKLNSKKVVILGDWNDDVDVSNHEGIETPFKSMIDDASLRFVTYYLSFALVQSSKYGSVIDHICITNELFGNFRSSTVVGVKDEIKGYTEVCSDHYPVYVVFE